MGKNSQRDILPCGVGSHFINIKMVQSTTEPLEHTIVLIYLCYKAGISKDGHTLFDFQMKQELVTVFFLLFFIINSLCFSIKSFVTLSFASYSINSEGKIHLDALTPCLQSLACQVVQSCSCDVQEVLRLKLYCANVSYKWPGNMFLWFALCLCFLIKYFFDHSINL